MPVADHDEESGRNVQRRRPGGGRWCAQNTHRHTHGAPPPPRRPPESAIDFGLRARRRRRRPCRRANHFQARGRVSRGAIAAGGRPAKEALARAGRLERVAKWNALCARCRRRVCANCNRSAPGGARCGAHMSARNVPLPLPAPASCASLRPDERSPLAPDAATRPPVRRGHAARWACEQQHGPPRQCIGARDRARRTHARRHARRPAHALTHTRTRTRLFARSLARRLLLLSRAGRAPLGPQVGLVSAHLPPLV